MAYMFNTKLYQKGQNLQKFHFTLSRETSLKKVEMVDFILLNLSIFRTIVCKNVTESRSET